MALVGQAWGAKLYIVPNLSADITNITYDPGNGETGNAYGNLTTAMAAAQTGDLIIFRSGTHARPTATVTINKLLHFSLYSNDSGKAYIPGQLTTSSFSWASTGDGSTWGPGIVIVGGGDGGNDAAHDINASGASFTIYPEVQDTVGRPVYLVNATNVTFLNAKVHNTTNGVLCLAGGSTWNNPYFYDVTQTEYDVFKITGGTHTINHGVFLNKNPQASCFYASSGTLSVSNSIIYHGHNTANKITFKTTADGVLNVTNCMHSTGIYTPHTTNVSGTVDIQTSLLNSTPDFLEKRPAVITFFLQDANHVAGGAWSTTSLKRYCDIAAANNFKLSFYPDDGNKLDESQIANIRQYISLGHEIGVTGCSSSRLDSVAPMQVSSSLTNPQLIINSDNSGECVVTLKSDGASDIVVPYTNKSDTAGENRYIGTSSDGLFKFINDQDGWSAQLSVASNFDDAYAYCLESETYTITNEMQNILWDETRWLTEEITNSKAYLVNSLQITPSILMSYYFPRNFFNSDALPILKDSGFLTAFYSGTNIVQPLSSVNLLGIQNIKILPATIRGTGYSDLSFTDKEARIRTWATNYGVIGSVFGSWIAIELNNTQLEAFDDTNTLTEDELSWIADSLRSAGGDILSFSEMNNYIRQGVLIEDDIYERVFDPLNNRVTKQSAAVNNGIWITGVNDGGEEDPWGYGVYKLPNIGIDQKAGIPKIGGSSMLQIGR